MPRENSFTDSMGRSLTPDLEEGFAQSFPVSRSASPTQVQVEQSLSPNKHSRKPAQRTSLSQSSNPPQLNYAAASHLQSPKDRFRMTVRKVISMHRVSTILARYGLAGAEPGVDPRRYTANIQYAHVRERCVIEITDYSTVRSSFGKMDNERFVRMLSDEASSSRESWAKVRWINVCGISWDVMSTLALKYDLHPLALEDILHKRGHTRSKTDYYNKHLFIHILSLTLTSSRPEQRFIPEDEDFLPPRSSSPSSMTPGDYHKKEYFNDNDIHINVENRDHTTYSGGAAAIRHRANTLRSKKFAKPKMEKIGEEVVIQLSPTRKESASRRRREKAQLSLDELKKDGRVGVLVQPMSIFLLRDGTVISIFPSNCIDFVGPIMARLKQPDTGLRASADPSLLVQSLLDLIVDSALEVVDAFHEKLLQLEHDVLMKADIKVVERLHILSGDLTLHKRTLGPLKTVIYGLRRYDDDRCAALLSPEEKEEIEQRGQKVKGFMSHNSKIYLADVHDHVEYILSSMDMFAGVTENLINYTFNVKSYEMNEVMRRLTLATIIFLPLTLLTGYFGMNFYAMWSVKGHTDILFWEIAIPLMAVIIPVFTWPDLKRVIHYAKKRWAARRPTLMIKHKLA